MSSETTWTWEEIREARKQCLAEGYNSPEMLLARLQAIAARRSQPAPEAVPVGERGFVNWSRFVPTEEIPHGDFWATAENGDYFASTFGASTVIGSIRVVTDHRRSARYVAGERPWDSTRCRLIRHADGRWADGYNPEGPCQPKCGTRFKRMSINSCEDFVSTGDNCYCVTDGNDDIACCTPFCADRAKAKAGEPSAGEPRPGGGARATVPAKQPAAPPGFRVVSTGGGDGGIVAVPDDVTQQAEEARAASSDEDRAFAGESFERLLDKPMPPAAPAVPQPGVPSGFVLARGWEDVGHAGTCTQTVDCNAPGVFHRKGAGYSYVCLAHAEGAGALVRVPVTPAGVQDEKPLSERMRECWRQGVFPGEGMANDCAALEARLANAAAGWAAGIDHEKSLMDTVDDLRAQLATRDAETKLFMDRLAEATKKRLDVEVATRDARIAKLEASSADLVRRAQEAEAELAEVQATGRDVLGATEKQRDDAWRERDELAAEVAELRGKLAAAVDEATAKERARCVQHAKYWFGGGWPEFQKRLASGVPAPEVG